MSTKHFCEVCSSDSHRHPEPAWAITTRFFPNPCCEGCPCGSYHDALSVATDAEKAEAVRYTTETIQRAGAAFTALAEGTHSAAVRITSAYVALKPKPFSAAILLIVLLGFTAGAFAQTAVVSKPSTASAPGSKQASAPGKDDTLNEDYFYSAFKYTSEASQTPRTVHDEAVLELRQYHMYEKRKVPEIDAAADMAYLMCLDGKCSGVSLGTDGLPVLTNISLEDALLLVMAMEAEDRLSKARAEDALEEQQRIIAKDIPPTKLKASQGTFTIEHVDRWTPYVEADTNCTLKQIHAVGTSSVKHIALLHEMMHVASHCDQDEDLHRAIQQIAPGLLQLMRANPEVVAWMMRKAPAPEGVVVAPTRETATR